MRALCRIAWTVVLAVAPVIMANAQAAVEWNETRHDFGIFQESAGDQSCKFVMTNTGDSALVVLRVQSTCGCTIAKHPTDAILPGESATIDVTYSPTGRPGPFEKGVWVYTNTKPNRTRLSIEGSVIGSTESVKKYYPVDAGDLQFTTLVMALGETKKGHSQSFSTTAYNTSNDTIVLKFDNNTSHITTIAVGDTIAPGKISTISFFFDSDKTPVWGINDDHITIIATPLHSGKAPWRIDANIIANVIEDFSKLTDKQRANSPVCSVNVQKLLIADMGRGESSSETVLVENTGKSNLIIRRAMSTDKAVVAKTDKTLVKPGEKAQISVGIYPKNAQGDLINSQLTIISNDPYNPRITIPIVGRIIQK